MRSIAAYIALMSQAIGITPSPGHVLLDSFNDAGKALYAAHNWRWLQKGPVILTGVANQDFLELPVDFGSCDRVFIDNTIVPNPGGHFSRVVTCSAGEIMDYRQQMDYLHESGTLFIAFPAGIDQAAVDAEPTQRALVYPTFTDGTTRVSLSYIRAWVDATDASDTKFPPIHPEWEQALVHQSRLVACQMEQMADQMAVEQAGLEGQLANLRKRDGGRQITYGKLRGGADRFIGRPVTEHRVAPVTL